MAWTKIEGNASVMLEAQWVLRAQNAPVCSLKRDREAGHNAWLASLLNRSGISCAMLHIYNATLEQAKADCESELREMGWQLTKEAT